MAQLPNMTCVKASKCVEDFTPDFHKNIAKNEKGNFISSPVSAHIVLSTAAYGASGKTAKTMKKALHLPNDNSEIHDGFSNLINTLNTAPKVTLRIATKIYGNKDACIKEKFKELTRTQFCSESETLDFLEAAKAVETINKWCAEKTNDQIRKIVTPETVQKCSGMILLNAVYFKGDWKDKFQERLTELRPFYFNKKKTVNVPTMNKEFHIFYKKIRSLNATCIALPYVNEDIIMIIIVPKAIDGIKKIEKNLKKIKLNYEDMENNKRYIDLYLPKFKAETTVTLDKPLCKMGMGEMFGEKAEFKGISDNDVRIDTVQQKAFLEVNEGGSVAVVVTAGVVRINCCMHTMPESKKFHVDRPFVYQIVDKRRKVTLFSGRIMDPSSN